MLHALAWVHRLSCGERVFEVSAADFHSQTIDGVPCKAWCRQLASGGALFFQERVSLLPPLVADLQPHHTVLDMCAAPGSKSSQAIGMLQAQVFYFFWPFVFFPAN